MIWTRTKIVAVVAGGLALGWSVVVIGIGKRTIRVDASSRTALPPFTLADHGPGQTNSLAGFTSNIPISSCTAHNRAQSALRKSTARSPWRFTNHRPMSRPGLVALRRLPHEQDQLLAHEHRADFKK